jgi:hypothetical protein
MTGSELFSNPLIISRSLILVSDHQANRRTGGDTIKHTRQDLSTIRFPPLAGML